MNIKITLPEEPLPGEPVKFLIANDTDFITFNFNGVPYLGLNTDTHSITLEAANEEVSLIYLDASLGWIPSSESLVIVTLQQPR